jgi:hypothetical protein
MRAYNTIQYVLDCVNRRDRFSMKKPLRSSARGTSFHIKHASNANVVRVVLMQTYTSHSGQVEWRRTAGRSWRRLPEDWAKWRVIGEAYIQQWIVMRMMMMMMMTDPLAAFHNIHKRNGEVLFYSYPEQTVINHLWHFRFVALQDSCSVIIV